MSEASFREKYGPWAVIAGASDGVGALFARAMAARGLDVVLLARRRAALEELAAEIRSEHGVEAREEVVDLATPDAAERVLGITRDLEVGMLMYNAGADPVCEPFLSYDLEPQLALVHRNVVVPTALCHRYGARMLERGRGGIVLVSSAGGMIGRPQIAVYGGSKAYEVVFGEALWSELVGGGVDVLVPILGATDTLAFRQLLTKLGVMADEDDSAQLPPEVVTAAEVVDGIIVNLANGPTWYAGEAARTASEILRTMSRYDAVRAVLQQESILRD